MTRLKFLFFFLFSLAGLCFGFFKISEIDIEQSKEEASLRMTQAQTVLQNADELQFHLNAAALSVTAHASGILTKIDTLLSLRSEDDGANDSMSALRGALNESLSQMKFEKLAPKDLVLVQTSQGLHAMDGNDNAEGSRFLTGDDTFTDLATAIEPAGHYALFENELYRISARKLLRPTQAQDVASKTDHPAAKGTEKDQQEIEGAQDAMEEAVFLAIARHIDDASSHKLATLLGVGVALAVDDTLMAASRTEETQRSKLAEQHTSGPIAFVPIIGFESLPLPIQLPLFVEVPASHQAQVLSIPGIDGGRIILDTQMDGLLMLAYLQKYFIVGLLIFLVIGILLLIFIGSGNDMAPVRVKAPMAYSRKVPIAGQSLSKAPGTSRTSGTATPPPEKEKKIKMIVNAGWPLPPEPGPHEYAPKTLSPDEFDFGSSPPAAALTPVPSQGTSPQSNAMATEAEANYLSEEEAFGGVAYQVAAEDFGGAAAGYSYPNQAIDYAAEAYPDASTSQVYETQTQTPTPGTQGVPGLYGAAENYQPAAPEGSESLESFYDDTADYQRLATRQMSIDALQALQASTAASGPAPWEIPADNATPEPGYGNGFYDVDQITYENVDPDEAYFQEIYNQFIALRAHCGEPLGALTYESFALKLRKNREQLMQKYNCSSVRFQVYMKEGKAALKATPVRS